MEELIDTNDEKADTESELNEEEVSFQRKMEFENFSKLLSEQSTFSLTPLENIGNTCYMNSILICLSHNLDLTSFFISKSHLSEINTKNESSLSNHNIIIRRKTSKYIL